MAPYSSRVFYKFAPMEHVLDNPVWSALISGNKQLTRGNDQVKYFDKEVALFAAFNENTPQHFNIMNELIQRDGTVIFVTGVKCEIPAPWKLSARVDTFQMVADKVIPYEPKVELITLTTQHVPQMVELTKLTNPGPFGERTIEFGHYRGIFEGDRLVAMAGQRINPLPYAEISAVCTHPDFLGRGYASELLQYQVNRIKAAGEIPMLHVRNDNERAIKVYEKLGFVTRANIYYYVLQKAR